MTAKVLVVDDSDTLRAGMRQILEEADLDVFVVEACDGAEALPIALAGDVDIVLSDIVMPNLDGIAEFVSRPGRDLLLLEPCILGYTCRRECEYYCECVQSCH